VCATACGRCTINLNTSTNGSETVGSKLTQPEWFRPHRSWWSPKSSPSEGEVEVITRRSVWEAAVWKSARKKLIGREALLLKRGRGQVTFLPWRCKVSRGCPCRRSYTMRGGVEAKLRMPAEGTQEVGT